MQRTDLFEKTLMVGKIEGEKRIENINRPIAITELKFIIKILITKRGPEGFNDKFYQTFKEK